MEYIVDSEYLERLATFKKYSFKHMNETAIKIPINIVNSQIEDFQRVYLQLEVSTNTANTIEIDGNRTFGIPIKSIKTIEQTKLRLFSDNSYSFIISEVNLNTPDFTQPVKVNYFLSSIESIVKQSSNVFAGFIKRATPYIRLMLKYNLEVELNNNRFVKSQLSYSSLKSDRLTNIVYFALSPSDTIPVSELERIILTLEDLDSCCKLLVEYKQNKINNPYYSRLYGLLKSACATRVREIKLYGITYYIISISHAYNIHIIDENLNEISIDSKIFKSLQSKLYIC